jgi:hypothetical protein
MELSNEDINYLKPCKSGLNCGNYFYDYSDKWAFCETCRKKDMC